LTRARSRDKIQAVCALRGTRLPARRRTRVPSRPIVLTAIEKRAESLIDAAISARFFFTQSPFLVQFAAKSHRMMDEEMRFAR
jgi:hypothetical protein